MVERVGARSEADLARLLGYSTGALSQWKKRGKVPPSAQQKVAAVALHGQNARRMHDRRLKMGQQVLYEGRSLAIWLAPSLDSFGRRFGATEFTARHREYASFFSEIEVACAEAVAERRATITGNATDAFELLTRDDPVDLFDRVLARAHWWRYGDVEEGRPARSQSQSQQRS